MPTLTPRSSLLRYFGAVLAAAFVPAAIFGLLTDSAWLFGYAFFVALAHAVVLGLPAAILLERIGRSGPITALVAGFLIGSLPLGLWMVLSEPAHFSQVGSTPTSIDGVRTAAGWLGILELVGLLGLLGAIGGFSAWLTWKATVRNS